MGGSAPTTKRAIGKEVQAVVQYLPALASVINQQVLPSELARLSATQAVSPEVAALQTQLYGQYGPALAEIGSLINRENALREAATVRDVIRGPGLETVAATREAEQALDPEFFAVREASSRALQDRLGGGLTGSERAEIERSLNKVNATRGTLDVPSATTTTPGALTFGRAGRNALDNALAQANQFLTTSRSGTNAFAVASGKTTTQNPGAGLFTGVQQPGNEANVLGSNLLGQAGQYQTMKGQQDASGGAAQVLASLPDY